MSFRSCVPFKLCTIIGSQRVHFLFPSRVGTFMHCTWLSAGSHTFSHPKLSYLPRRFSTVKALHYHPLLGLLLQMVWGLVGTSYQGDPLNFGRSNTVNISGTRRRARWQDEPLKSVLNLCTYLMASHQIITHHVFLNPQIWKCGWEL